MYTSVLLINRVIVIDILKKLLIFDNPKSHPFSKNTFATQNVPITIYDQFSINLSTFRYFIIFLYSQHLFFIVFLSIWYFITQNVFSEGEEPNIIIRSDYYTSHTIHHFALTWFKVKKTHISQLNSRHWWIPVGFQNLVWLCDSEKNETKMMH